MAQVSSAADAAARDAQVGAVRRRALVLAPWAWPLALPQRARAAPAPASTPPPALPGDPAAGLLRQALAEPLQTCRLPLHCMGLQVKSLDTGAVLFGLNDAHPYVMASTAKIVTTLAAFEMLGPGYHWRTQALASAPLRDGRLAGDLIILDGGNALLNRADLALWFLQLRAQGLQHVGGHIVLDRLAGSEFEEMGEPARLHPSRRTVHLAWLQAGGTLGGRVVERPGAAGPAERGRTLQPLSVYHSPPLAALVREINKHSDNHAAHSLMLSLAADGAPRETLRSVARRRVRDWLEAKGIGARELVVDLGSGLSRSEQATPRALVQLLAQAWSSRHANAFVSSLPLAGVDGTLVHRMRHGAAAGRAWLKTGTLSDARALAGYVQAESGHTYAVAAFVNHGAARRATAVLDRFIEKLAALG